MKAGFQQIRAQLDSPSGDIRLFLLHGPDEAGAMELAARLQRALGPDAERVELEGATLRSNPGMLADEAASLSLFGEKRHIRVTGAGEECLEAFTLLLNAPSAANPVVAIAPGVKTSGKIVKLAIAAPAAMAHACYVPEGAEAVKLASAVAREHGLRLAGDAAEQLASATGGDRAILAREIEKLALYLDAAPDRPRDADLGALEAVGASLDDSGMFRAIEAVIDGDAATAGRELAAIDAGGGSAIPLLRQLARRLITLAELRAEVDGGASAKEAVERHRIFFREQPATMRALRRWSSPQLARAVDRVRAVERDLLRSGGAGAVLAQQEGVAIARAASRFR